MSMEYALKSHFYVEIMGCSTSFHDIWLQETVVRKFKFESKPLRNTAKGAHFTIAGDFASYLPSPPVSIVSFLSNTQLEAVDFSRTFAMFESRKLALAGGAAFVFAATLVVFHFASSSSSSSLHHSFASEQTQTAASARSLLQLSAHVGDSISGTSGKLFSGQQTRQFPQTSLRFVDQVTL